MNTLLWRLNKGIFPIVPLKITAGCKFVACYVSQMQNIVFH